MRSIFHILALVIIIPVATAAQGNGFSFQGRLNDGTSAANGSYDLQFKLFDALNGGNQIGAMVAKPNTVLANGVFSVTLDFGASAFNNPASIFIEIAVKPNGSPNAYTILGPRQQLTVVPYAVRAMNATNADHATNAENADNATFALSSTFADNSTDASNLGGHSAASYARLDFGNTGYLQTSGDLIVGGNVRPVGVESNGLVKAMISVTSGGAIVRCYNSITNSSVGNCGFIITQPSSGIFRIDFGFTVTNRFPLVSAQYVDSGGTGVNNSGVNYRAFSSTMLEVFTFASGNSADTQPRAFTMLLY